jgi:hypothetical protein
VGARKSAVTDLAGGLAAIDELTAAVIDTVDGGKRGALGGGVFLSRTRASTGVAAALRVLSAKLAIRATTTQVLATLKAGAVAKARVRAAIFRGLTGLADHPAADDARAAELSAVATFALAVAAIVILPADFALTAAQAAGDAAGLAVGSEDLACLRAALVVAAAELSGIETRRPCLTGVVGATVVAAAVRVG